MRDAAHAVRLAVIGLFASAFAFACEASVNASLQHKECNSRGECLPGWVCSIDQVCVEQSARARGDSQDATPEAGPSDADADVKDPTSVSSGCAAGTLCGGSCVDLTRTTEHCGACDRRCADIANGRPECNGGACDVVCDESYTRCGDGCYHLSDDPQHCGSCTSSCPSPQNGATACAAGTCRATCNAGFMDCGGACVGLETDVQNCGACGKACEEDQQCAAGICVRGCPDGTLECARSCVDPKTDLANCGACGNACPPRPGAVPVCLDGACASRCNAGLTACGEACVDAQVDLVNCGTCGKVCPRTASRGHAVCAAGSCRVTCDEGFVVCDDQCLSPALAAQRNQRTTCAELALAQDRLMCQGQVQNTTYCAGECVNVATNEQHCGQCNKACAEAESCLLGNCR